MKIPITKEFDDKEVVGWVELTPEFKAKCERSLVESRPGSNDILVLSPAYISDFPDENGVTHEAELISFSAIPSHRAYHKGETNG